MATTRLLSAMVATWNNVATTFTGLKLNVTDTASAAGSLLMDLQADGVSKFRVGKGGGLISSAGVYHYLGGLSSTAITTPSDGSVRISNSAGTNFIDLTASGSGLATLSGGLIVGGINAYGNLALFSNAGSVFFGTGLDLVITRDAANVLALRNGTAAQAFNIYNTYTDASNYERAELTWNATANAYIMRTIAAGTGSFRNIILRSGGTLTLGSASADRWVVNFGGHFVGVDDNTYDIGESGANRPRTIYAGTSFVAPDAGTFRTPTRGSISFPVDGSVAFANFAGTQSVTFTVGASNLLTLNGGLTTGQGITSGGSIGIPGASQFSFLNRARIFSPADSILQVINAAQSDFTRLILGTNDASGIAIKKNGTAFNFVLGNDTGDAAITSSKVTTSATDFFHNTSAALANGAAAQVATMTNGPTAGNPTKWIAINDNGVTRYIPAW